MLQRVRLQTPDGIREYVLVPGTNEFDTAKAAGEIHIGDEIVYRNYLAAIIDDFEMLVLETLQAMPFAGPEYVPNMGGFAGGVPDMGSWRSSPDGTQWSFTVNGQPVTPEQAAQFMRGGPMGN